MTVFIPIAVILLAAFVLVRLSARFKIPSVVALIVCGLVIGMPWIESRLIAGHAKAIVHLGDIGLVCLMFLAGLESSWKMLYREKKDAALIAVFAAFVPLLIGFLVFILIGYSMQTALIIGICMSISAEATRAKVLMELDKMKTRLGAALIGAGIIDDVLGLSLFVLITYFVKQAGTKEELLIVASIIAFFVGLVVKRLIGTENKFMKLLEKLVNYFIIPFFFVSIGTHFKFNSLMLNPLILGLIFIIAAIGKFVGVFLAKPFMDFAWRQLYLAGWSMNSRGALELAIALIAFRSQLVSVQLYSSLVIMALATTLAFPPVITRMIGKDPKIMD